MSDAGADSRRYMRLYMRDYRRGIRRPPQWTLREGHCRGCGDEAKATLCDQCEREGVQV